MNVPERLMPTLVVAACLATACQFAENRYMSRRVGVSELYGKWVATPFSGDEKSLADVGFTSHLNATDQVLIIRSDGTCSAQTFLHPYWDSPVDDHWLTPAVPCNWALGQNPVVILPIKPLTYRLSSREPKAS